MHDAGATSNMEQEQKIQDLERRVKYLEDLLLGIQNDVRFQAKVRRQIFEGEHTANKPKIINEKGKTYNVQTV